MKNACQGDLKLNKKAFISMLGATKFVKPNFNPLNTLKNQEITKIKKLLEENNGNKQKTAALLGISISSLKRKLDQSSVIIENINDDQLASPNSSRRYFENLKTDWQITSFNSQNKEVCIDLNNRSTTVRVSVNVSNFE